jgi:hypothetical protein
MHAEATFADGALVRTHARTYALGIIFKSRQNRASHGAVKVLGGTIRRESAATCSARGLTFMN